MGDRLEPVRSEAAAALRELRRTMPAAWDGIRPALEALARDPRPEVAANAREVLDWTPPPPDPD